MKRRDPETVGDVARLFLRQNGLETPLNELRLINAWPKLLGAAAKYTTRIYVYNQVLHVSLSSSVLRNELMMRRAALVAELNRLVGTMVITNIVFH